MTFDLPNRTIHFHTDRGGVILWNEADTASGNYSVTAVFSPRVVPGHDSYGIFWGGTRLEGAQIAYGYFLAFGNGNFMVKSRTGPGNRTFDGRGGTMKDLHILAKETATNAIHPAADSMGRPLKSPRRNQLEVRIAPESIYFFANNRLVAKIASATPSVPTSGLFGVRVNHNMAVAVQRPMRRTVASAARPTAMLPSGLRLPGHP